MGGMALRSYSPCIVVFGIYGPESLNKLALRANILVAGRMDPLESIHELKDHIHYGFGDFVPYKVSI